MVTKTAITKKDIKNFVEDLGFYDTRVAQAVQRWCVKQVADYGELPDEAEVDGWANGYTQALEDAAAQKASSPV